MQITYRLDIPLLKVIIDMLLNKIYKWIKCPRKAEIATYGSCNFPHRKLHENDFTNENVTAKKKKQQKNIFHSFML